MAVKSGMMNQKALMPARRIDFRKPASALRKRKAAAKMGMTGSMGALVISGLFKFQGAKSLHLYSGLGLLAFAFWHHLLNQPRSKSVRG
ncbi:MAG: hypothetical protein P8010_13820 [Desulfosarcinaceae bacterium]|jgi:hypothetical protein